MGKRILIIQGHPDPTRKHFGHAIASAYQAGAQNAGHEVRLVEIAKLHFSFLQSADDWDPASMDDDIVEAQDSINWANHIVLIFPLWLGTMPAIVKGFLENVISEGFAIDSTKSNRFPKPNLKGKSARLIVTMGMPSLLYRWLYRSHGLKNLERNILRFSGIGPVRWSLLGLVEGSHKRRTKFLDGLGALGSVAA